MRVTFKVYDYETQGGEVRYEAHVRRGERLLSMHVGFPLRRDAENHGRAAVVLAEAYLTHIKARS